MAKHMLESHDLDVSMDKGPNIETDAFRDMLRAEKGRDGRITFEENGGESQDFFLKMKQII